MMIETARLILRPWAEEDAEALYEYAKDPAVGPAAGWQPHTSVENSLEVLRNVLCTENTFAVCLKSEQRAIGGIGLKTPTQELMPARNTELEVGYWVGVPFWGNGYIPEAVCAIMEYAFRNLGCTALWCGYYEGNIKSKRCMEKCGFAYHHTETSKPCPLLGEIRTEHYTYLTKEQWVERTATKS